MTRTDEAGRARAFTYDALGGLDTASDLAGTAWAYDYDAVVSGELRFDVESGRVWLDGGERIYGLSTSTDELEEVQPWRHALSDVTSPEGEVTRWSRDASGRVDLVEYPYGGTEVRTYGADGQLATVTLPHGTTLAYDTDVAGRVRERTGTDGSLITYAYGAGDRVSEHTDATGTTTHHHDTVGRYTGLTQPTGASVRFGRDRLDRIDAVRVREPGAATDRETSYVYDAGGNITEIHDPLGGITAMTYDAAGRLATRTLPNGVLSTWAYDVRSRIASITHATATGTVLASVAYVRAPSGEPTRITREDGTYVEYGYDAALRLERETYYDASAVQVDEITYAYDQDGNRTRRVTSAGEEIYTYGSGSRLTDISVGGVPIATYAYDGAGRVTTMTRGADERVLAWDADDHVTSITRGTEEVVFDFDALGRRVRAERRTAGVRTDAHRYVIAPTLAESLESPHMAITDAGAPRVGWVFQGEHPLFRYDPMTGDIVYYLQDSMGSTIGLVGTTPTTTATIHYDGFGTERAATGPLASLPAASGGDFRFQGMWLDQGTGLYYVRARSYDTASGRLLSRDPVIGVPAEPETRDPYGFARNTPTQFTDPTGEVTLQELGANLVSARVLASIAVSTLFSLGANWCDYNAERISGAEYFGQALFSGAIAAVGGAYSQGLAAAGAGILRRLAFSVALSTLSSTVFRWVVRGDEPELRRMGIAMVVSTIANFAAVQFGTMLGESQIAGLENFVSQFMSRALGQGFGTLAGMGFAEPIGCQPRPQFRAIPTH
ncbi:MAG: hypothetical protein M3Y87_31655 [Myxococcota bacterium]|nr:hypothetical protein [Myxococcota bacterium]